MSESSYFLNDVLGVYLKSRFQTAHQAISWGKKNGINGATMRDVFYKKGKCGRKVLNQIVMQLLELNREKVVALVDQVRSLQPITQSQRIWNSIEASELTKRRLALVARATVEIEVNVSQQGRIPDKKRKPTKIQAKSKKRKKHTKKIV